MIVAQIKKNSNEINNNEYLLLLSTWLWLTRTEQMFCLVPEFDRKHRKKAEGRINRNIVNKTMKMKTIVGIISVIKLIELRQRNFDEYLSILEVSFVLCYIVTSCIKAKNIYKKDKQILLINDEYIDEYFYFQNTNILKFSPNSTTFT